MAKMDERQRQLRYKYKMTLGDYDHLLRLQDEKCAICGCESEGFRAFSVDHDHGCCNGIPTCGECTRGLLCGPCNKGLGSFRDNIGNLAKAIEYLKKWNQQS